jgi:hypothetical protein
VVEFEMEAVGKQVLQHQAELLLGCAGGDGGVHGVEGRSSGVEPVETRDLIGRHVVGLLHHEEQGGARPGDTAGVVRAGASERGKHPSGGDLAGRFYRSHLEGQLGVRGLSGQGPGKQQEETESGGQCEFHSGNSSTALYG